MNLQQRILEVLSKQGPCPIRGFLELTRGVDPPPLIEREPFDCALRHLLAEKKILSTGISYLLPAQMRRMDQSSLTTETGKQYVEDDDVAECRQCQAMKPIEKFQRFRGGTRAKVCNDCRSVTMRAYRARMRAEAAHGNGGLD